MATLNDILPLIRKPDRPFYYGQGGIGDFLLLMSTFYDDVEQDEVNVVFCANNTGPMMNLIDQFPKVHTFYILPGPIMDPTSWPAIDHNPLCLGTGVTPRGFNYIQDWIKCGESNVFDYYGVKRYPEWAQANKHPGNIVIQPFGGADDKSKKKEIPSTVLHKIIKEHAYWNIIMVGSEEDSKNYPRYYWAIDFDDAFNNIKRSHKFIGCDSWGKTLAGLAGVETIIYPNQYDRPVEEIFGHPKDPSDYVFLEGWGFKYA